MARGKRKLEVVITGDSRQLEGAFRRSGKASQSFGRKLAGGAGKGLMLFGKGAAVAAVAAGVGFAAALRHGIKGAMDHQKVMAQTESVLKSTKNAVNTSTQAIEANATALEMKTGIDGDAIQSGMNLMATFGKVRNELGKGNDIFDQANKTALDMSVTFGTSTTAASIQLGKALQDPIKGVTALTRVGVSFSQAQKDQIKTLVESGDVMGAQKLILAEVNKQVGGSAEAFGKTLPGQIERAKRAFDALTEAVAGPFLPLLGDIAEGLLNVFGDPAVQARMEQFSRDITVALQKVVAWVRANWPTIRAVIGAVLEGIRFTVQNILVPAGKAIITAFQAVVSFFQTHMPTIRRVTADAFGWIDKHIVPTVREVSQQIGVLVGAMTRFWERHGDIIKAVVGVAYKVVFDIIKGALLVIKGLIEFSLAAIRGDWSAAFGALKTIVRGAFTAATSVIRNVGGALASAAINVGSRVIDGVISGISNGASRLKSAIEQKLRDIIKNLSPFSPVEHGGAIISDRLTNGFIEQAKKNRAKWANSLKQTMREAVQSARGNLSSLTSTLASMLGQIFGRTYRNAANKTLSELQGAYDTMMREREKSRLDADKAEAQSEVERLEAISERTEEQEQELRDARQRLSDSILALSDWQAQEEIRLAQQAIDEKARQYEEDIANLTASFNEGKITAEEFRDRLAGLIGGATGSELGFAFATEFGAQLKAVADQIAALVGVAPGAGGPTVQDPHFDQRMEQWKNRKKQLEDALAQARKDADDPDGPQGRKRTAAEQRRIDRAKDALTTHNKNKPKRLADGGILRRAVLAGEAGPEAVLPLGSGRAQRMLSDALEGVDGIGHGGTTIIHVTVNGNEFSAAEFARKLAPELRRNVALTRST